MPERLDQHYSHQAGFPVLEARRKDPAPARRAVPDRVDPIDMKPPEKVREAQPRTSGTLSQQTRGHVAGDHSAGETPVPIPNTAVKPRCADGTAGATWWESTSSPASYFDPPERVSGGFFFTTERFFMHDTRAGTVALAGAPNVGKSTLLNAFVGEKLSIVTPKPQTTWRQVAGIYSGPAHQIIFVDTPGLFAARDLFHRGMVETACRAVEDADIVLVVLDAVSMRTRGRWGVLRTLLAQTTAPRMVALNKIDAVPGAGVEVLAVEAERALDAPVFPVSALDGTGVEALREALEVELPRSPFLYPDDLIASDPVRSFTAEFVRESVFELYHEEIPYAVWCRIEQFREDSDPTYIQATLYAERPSQKGILIGNGGRAIRELGSLARSKIERFVGRRVYLDLRVKVLAGWRRKRGHLRRLGFAVPRDPETKRTR